MSVTYKCLKIFYCSTGKASPEEAAVRTAIDQLNKGTRAHLGIEFELFSWNDLIPRSTDSADQSKQDEINEHLKNCDIFILVVRERLGHCESGERLTNFQREIELALERWRNRTGLTILSYFKRFYPSVDGNAQERGAMNLKAELAGQNVFFTEYDKPAQFRTRILPDLYERLLELEFDSPKQRALRNFWKFGYAERRPRRRLLVSYPGMDRAYMRLPENDHELWIRRLVPNIVYEDHRAMQKIDKVLQLIRMSDIHTCTIANLPDDWRYMNRFWICIPRNRMALKRLEDYSDKALFQFQRKNGEEDEGVEIMWKKDDSSSSFPVRSPLKHYLQIQRKGDELTGEWNRHLRDVVARDYAIIARFMVRDGDIQMREGHLMEYFLGGIRGLGTWGAAWFVDRQWSAFEACKDNESFQRLLEVTYVNGAIDIVRDVSQQSPEYFAKQLNPKFIRETIDECMR